MKRARSPTPSEEDKVDDSSDDSSEDDDEEELEVEDEPIQVSSAKR